MERPAATISITSNSRGVSWARRVARIDPTWIEQVAPHLCRSKFGDAHWDEKQQKRSGDYDQAFEDAASKAETLLAFAGHQILPKLLETYPTLVWEDQDECLEVRPEDIKL